MTSIHSDMSNSDTAIPILVPPAPVGPVALSLPRRGLANVGNTCYLNSALQALRYSRPFAEYFGGEAWLAHRHPDRKGHALTGEVVATLQAMNAPAAAGGRAVIPSKLVREFVMFGHDLNEEIRFGAQADAAEAVQILLDGLHTQQAREVSMIVRGETATPELAEYARGLESWASFFRKEYSPIVENFYGQTQTRIICTDCGENSTRYEPWGILKVPIPGADRVGAPAPSLHDCIASALATETLDDYTCDKCKKRGAARIEHSLSRLPKYLILSLKRFTNTGAKVRARIPYNESDISFAEWRTWPTLQAEKLSHYRLYATVEHLGTSRGGHYIMRARDGIQWMVYDDGMCAPSAIGGDAAPDTYMLFMERCD
jgi:ubiquitin C-terminal hydrolase